MPGLGLQGAYGAAGGEDALKQMIVERLKAEAVQQQLAQQGIENQQRDRQLSQGDRRLDLEAMPQPEKPMVVNGRIVMPSDPSNVLADFSAPKPPGRLITTNQGGKPILTPEDQAVGMEAYQKPETTAPKEERIVPVKTVDEQGNSVTKYLPESQVRGQTFREPTPGGAGGGQLGLQGARADSAINMLQHLQDVHAKLQTGEGPGQIVRGIAAATGGRINLNNAATEYQKLRRATAVALAVAIQGSRPSDADAEAMASLLPDFNTPAEVARNLFAASRAQLEKTSANMHNTRQAGGSAVAKPLTARNPTTGEVLYSDDGGKSWHK